MIFNRLTFFYDTRPAGKPEESLKSADPQRTNAHFTGRQVSGITEKTAYPMGDSTAILDSGARVA